MIRKSIEVGSKVFNEEFGFGEILKINDDKTVKVKFEWFIIPRIERKNLNEVE